VLLYPSHCFVVLDNGNEYDGTWVANKRDGNGTTKYASGNMYVGEELDASQLFFA
jgi:hypothetical protein